MSDNSRHPFTLDFLANVNVPLNKTPEIIGVTPEGLKADFFLIGGSVSGPKLNAKVLPEGGDWMTLRPDGIGVLGVRATLETPEGGLIYASYSGVFELGEDGYQNFLNKKWPPQPLLRTAPKFLTAHPNYLWLNRLQCIGIGHVNMAELVVNYDLYAVR
jgi:hypothetical protein